MKKELIGVRLSADVMAEVRAEAEANGETLTAIVEQALIAHLGLGDSSGGGRDLAARVADIEQRLSQLEASGQAKATGRRGKGRR